MCFSANAQINGPSNACTGNPVTYNFSGTIVPGISYSWSVNPAKGVPYGGGITVNIIWLTPGTDTVKVVRYGGGKKVDSFIKVVTVTPPPQPFITTTTILACESFDTTKTNPAPPLFLSDSACTRVCDSSYISYSASGGGATDKHKWNVSGGIIIGDSTQPTVLVFWTGPGTAGTITLSDTSAGGCYAVTSGCVLMTPKPHSSFAIDTNSVHLLTDTVCLNSKVQFKSLATADTTSSITSYYWTFGDGFTSTVPNPLHTFPVALVHDTVRLVVTNACGCTDTSTTIIYVNTLQGPDIQCIGVKCKGDTAVYSTPNPCAGATYHWSVSAGNTILSTLPYGPTIEVRWDSGGANGFGTISLSETGCATLCPGTTTMQVPVVQSRPTVTGPKVLCVHKPYQFSIPLWPGTQYHWGVINYPSAIVSGHFSNTVAVQFDTVGTYQIHVWYKNSLKLCGGDTTFTVTIANPPTISGPTIICSYSTPTYTLSGGFSGNWTLTEPDGSIVTRHGTSFVMPTLTKGGPYTLSITGTNFCTPNPVNIQVGGPVPPIDALNGKTTVCTGQPYQYNVYADKPGYTYQWAVTNGTRDTLAGDSITVSWVGSGNLQVYRILRDTPYCVSSPPVIESINPYVLNAEITGASTVCEESSEVYYNNVPDSTLAYVKWSIHPDTHGSIVSGYEGSNATILWTDDNTALPHYDTVQCIVTQCGITDTATEVVNMRERAIPFVGDSIQTGHFLTLCNGVTDRFFTDTGYGDSASYYVWVFSDGAVDTTTTNYIYHTINLPKGSGLTALDVHVTPYGTIPGYCSVFGTGDFTFYVTNPHVAISTRNPLNYCGTPTIKDTLHTTTISAVGAKSHYFYSWYKSGTLKSSGIYDTTYVATDTGTYYIVFTDSTACASTSDTIHIRNIGSCAGVCPHKPTASLTTNCNVITGIATSAGSGIVWSSPNGTVSNPHGDTTTITYSGPGYYQIDLYQVVSGCGSDTTMIDSVELVSYFEMEYVCDTFYRGIQFTDQSLHLPSWVIDSTHWHLTKNSIVYKDTTANNPQLRFKDSGTYYMTETVYAHSGTLHQTCTDTRTINVPVFGTALTPYQSTTSSCEGVPINFSMTAAPDSFQVDYYFWWFGDGAASFSQSVSRSYTYDPGKDTFGRGYDVYTILYEAMDLWDCELDGNYDFNKLYDTIYHNDRADKILGDSAVCPGLLDTLSILKSASSLNPSSYFWSDGNIASTDYVAVSGIYTATIYDQRRCWDKTPMHGVSVLTPPDLTIDGKKSYCPGETVTLSYFPTPPYTYQWFLDSAILTGDTAKILNMPGLAPGTYVFELHADDPTHNCLRPVVFDTVVVHPQPSAPLFNTITAISCPKYELRLSVDTIKGYKYNWSNGTFGYADTVFAGGPYRVWCTDTFGCVNYSDTTAPYSPESYLAWFPAGCYLLCNQAIKDSLHGPPGKFPSWLWMKNSSPDGTGTNSPVNPLGINATAAYQLAISNGLCSATSDNMNVTAQNCSGGTCPAIQSASLSCDPATPAGYILNLTFNSGIPPTTKITIGVDIGPVEPFTYSYGSIVTLHFTTLRVPIPSSVLVEATFTMPSGQVCYDTFRINVIPPCTWSPERIAGNNAEPMNTLQKAATGMLVYPNPAGDIVNVNYNYGYPSDVSRNILIYDVAGRIITTRSVKNETGTIAIPINNIGSGSYIVRMEENGRTVHIDHLSVVH